ncbi:unnamed protein product [Rhodiola kirilowii]
MGQNGVVPDVLHVASAPGPGYNDQFRPLIFFDSIAACNFLCSSSEINPNKLPCCDRSA